MLANELHRRDSKYKYGFQAEKEGQKVEHHICVSHLPRLANPGTSQQMEDQADIKVGTGTVWFSFLNFTQASCGRREGSDAVV
jgi:hypothetical protein